MIHLTPNPHFEKGEGAKRKQVYTNLKFAVVLRIVNMMTALFKQRIRLIYH